VRLRQLFEANGKTAAFAFGRLNPATIGHERLVAEILRQPGDAFLFLSDRPAKLPTDPLSAAEKLDWAQKSFNNISVGLAKTALIAADRLYKMGYTNLIYLEGEAKMGAVIKKYNGIEAPLHNFNFNNIDLVQLTRKAASADDDKTIDPATDNAEKKKKLDPAAMSATKLRGYAINNDFESFTMGVTKSAQPYAEEMFKKLQGLLGVNEAHKHPEVYERQLSKKEIKARDKYAEKDLPKGDFKKRYGDDWENVLYGTATNMAKRNKN